MALRINYNQVSIGAQHHLARTQSAFEQAVRQFSSGLRINRAADDSAGLAVSEKLKNQVRGLSQARRNAQDVVSLLQTAEGALTQTQGLLARMRELAVQSANDTLTNNDRVHIQNEVNQLVSEIDRIAQSTQYNQISLLNKNSVVSLHNGGDALQFHIGANTNLVSGAPSAASGDNGLQYSIPAGRAQDLGDVKTLKSIDATITSGDFTITGSGSATIKIDPSVDTIFDLRDLINAQTGTTAVTASVSGGRLTLSSSVVSTITVADGTSNLVTKLGIPTSITQGAVTGSTLVSDVSSGAGGQFYIDDGATSLTPTVTYTSSMTLNQVAAAMQTAIRTLVGESAATVTVTGGGAFKIANLVGSSVVIDPTLPAAFGLPVDPTPLASGPGGTTGSAMVTIIASGSSNSISSGVTSLVSGAGGTVAVGSQTSANASISVLDAAIESVSSSRGSIGALQNRLLSAMNNLGVASENTAAANSRIRDTDIAQAVSEMTRTQILQQSTMAVLAQANQAPISVVQLLK
jgi:flagellin